MNSSLSANIRSLLRSCVLSTLGCIATPAPGIHILNGHRIEKEIEPDTFRRLLTQLSGQARFVRIEEAVKMIVNREHPDKPVVAFTFDDGFMECYTLFAPLLQEFGTNAMFFINPNYVDGDEQYIRNFNDNIVMTPGKNPMRWHHIKDLSQRGHIIGAHTLDHFMINSEDRDILHHQICDCKHIIENQLGTECEYFAFPYGKLSQANNQAIDIACNCYKYVFSQSDHKHYFSFEGRVINRRHFEPFWPISHVRYFLSCNKR